MAGLCHLKNKVILHLCADSGSDSYPYKVNGYKVITVGKDIGVENYTPPADVVGIIANPVCTEFSIADGYDKKRVPSLKMVNACIEVINKANPSWYAIENPATGRLKDYLGKPTFIYQPWEFGDPWTKRTALWGNFKIPAKVYYNWQQVPKNNLLYARPGRKPSLAFMHKSAIQHIETFWPFRDSVKNDSDFRSLCPQGFATAFFNANP